MGQPGRPAGPAGSPGGVADPPRHVTVGVDIGQRVDPTAIAVVEAAPREPGGEHHFHVRYLKTLPLGTDYVVVAQQVVSIIQGVVALTGEPPLLYVDATGVGKPPLDMIRRGLRHAKLACRAVPVYFTYGDKRTVNRETGGVALGKAYLVSRLQAILQDGRLHMPAGRPELALLIDELLAYEIRVTKDANEQYGAFKVGTHDDMVTALGLCVQTEPAGALDARAVSLRGRGASLPVNVPLEETTEADRARFKTMRTLLGYFDGAR